VHLLAGFARFHPDVTPEMILQAPGRALWAAVARRADETFSIGTVEFELHTRFSYQSAKQRQTLLRRPLPSWARYAGGILVLMSQHKLDMVGFDMVVAGNERDVARYEYAVGLAFAAVYYTLSGTPFTEAALVDLAERTRREYILTS
jgi:galactokinase